MVGVTEGVFELVDGLATIIDGQSGGRAGSSSKPVQNTHHLRLATPLDF